MNTNLVFLLLIISNFSCNSTKDFDRSKELFNYLNKVQNLNFEQKKAQVFIFQVGFCGACTGEVMMLIEENKNLFVDSTYFILSKADKTLERRLSKINNSQILLDKSPLLAKYGLSYSKDMLFFIENEAVQKWFKLDTDGTKAAAHYLNR
jgi:hypothetical protein